MKCLCRKGFLSCLNGSSVIYDVRTSGEVSVLSSLHCGAKEEKEKRVPE